MFQPFKIYFISDEKYTRLLRFYSPNDESSLPSNGVSIGFAISGGHTVVTIHKEQTCEYGFRLFTTGGK